MDALSIKKQWDKTPADEKRLLTGLEQDVFDIISEQLPQDLKFSEDGQPLDEATNRFVAELEKRNKGISSGFLGSALCMAKQLEGSESLQEV